MKCRQREKRQQVRDGGLGVASVVRTGVMWSDLGFVEHGQTWLILLYESVFAALELSQDEKITRGERGRVPTKRWKPLRSLAQTDKGGDERRASRGGDREKRVTSILFVRSSLTKPVVSDIRCVETDRRRREGVGGLFHASLQPCLGFMSTTYKFTFNHFVHFFIYFRYLLIFTRPSWMRKRKKHQKQTSLS